MTNICGCIENDYEYIETSFFRRLIRTAHKIHGCYECHRAIQVGERYEYVSAKQEGDIWSAKTCQDCLSMRDRFFDGSFCVGAIWDELCEHMFNVDGEISEDCIAPLTPKAREMVCETIEDYWERYLEDEDEELCRGMRC